MEKISGSSKHLLASLIRCKYCNGPIKLINKGIYGCHAKSCDNKFVIPSARLEAIILKDLQEKFLTVESLKKLADEIAKVKQAELAEKHPPENELFNENSYYVAHTSIQTLALLE